MLADKPSELKFMSAVVLMPRGGESERQELGCVSGAGAEQQRRAGA